MDPQQNNSNPQGQVYGPQVGATQTPPQEVVQPQADAGFPVAPVPPSAPDAPKPKFALPKISKNVLMIAVGIIALLGILGFLANMFLFSKKETSKEVTLTYWGLWEDQAAINQLITEYQTQNPDIKINYVKQAKEDYRERLVNAQAQAKGPDIFRFHNTWVPMLSTQLSAIPASVYDANTFQSTFYPVTSRDLQRGSDLVGIPLMFDGLALYINETIFSAAGKNPPATWDELRTLARELTIKDDQGRIQQSGVALGRTENVDHWEDILSLMMLQNGVDMANPTDKLAQDALAFYTVFNTQDLVWDETMPPSTQAFAGGKLAMYLAPSWRTFEIKQQNPNLSFRVVPAPQLPKNEPTDPDITWASYWAEGVSSKSEAQEEAWKFLRFLSEKNSQQKLYSNVSQSRLFGPIYSRVDMANLLVNDPYVGAYVSQAPKATSWYLASRTFDGPTGINSRIAQYFKDAINGVVIERQDPEEVLQTVAQGVSQVLGSYQGSR